MPIAKIQLPDGRIGKFEVPEGTTPEQVMEFANKRFSAAQEQPEQSWRDKLGGYVEGRKEAIGEVFTPEYWKSVASDLSKPLPPIDWNNIGSSEAELDMVLRTLPVTRMGAAARNVIAPRGIPENILQAGKSGYAFPRSNIKPTWMNQLAERFGGKQAIEHTATIQHQTVTNKLAAKALGLPENTPITQELLKGLRDEAGKSYEVIKNIGNVTADKTYRQTLSQLKASKGLVTGPADKQVKSLVDELMKNNIPADKAIETVKQLRFLSKANLKSLSPAEKSLGKVQIKAANAIEELIERNIEPTLGKEVLQNFRNARKMIAKTYTVENSLNPSTSNVVANKIVKQGKYQPLEGELKEISHAAQINPRLGREPIGAPPSGGLFEPLVYGTTGTVVGGPAGAAAALIPIFGKPLARKMAVTIPKTQVPGRLDNYFLQRGLFGAGMQGNALKK